MKDEILQPRYLASPLARGLQSGVLPISVQVPAPGARLGGREAFSLCPRCCMRVWLLACICEYLYMCVLTYLLYYIILYYIILYYIIIYYTILYYIILYCIILYNTILYYIILYYII